MRSVFSLAAASLLFFGLGLAQLRTPGLMYDEAADAVPAMELLLGQTPSIARSVALFGREWPLMMLDHIGAASVYTSAAGFALFGVSVETLRATQLVVGWLALLLLWLLAKQWADERTANVAVLLAASAPVMVWWSRFGANYTVPLLPIALGMLAALTHAWRRRSTAAAVLAAFLFGAGVATKILFIWLVAPLAVTAFVHRRALASMLREWPQRGLLLLTLPAVMFGAAPLIAHNLASGFATFRFVLGNAAQTRLYGHDNFAFGSNLSYVTSEFLRAMGGDIRASEAPIGPPLGALAFVAALVVGIASLVRRRAASPWFTFVVLTPLTVLPLSTVSTSSIGATYVFVIVPLAWLLIAWAATRFAPPKYTIAGTALLVVANIAGNIFVHEFFARTGGRGHWSDAVYAVSADLETTYAGRPVVAMDWGFRRNVNLLTRDAVEPNEVFGYAPQPDASFLDVATVLLRDPRTLYLFHEPQATLFHGRLEMLQRAAAMQHKSLAVQRTYSGRDGEPAILLYAAQNATTNFTPNPAFADRNAVIGDLTLLGGRVTYDDARREVRVDLQWRSNAERLASDAVLMHVIDQSTGALVADGDHQPVYDNHPFDRWQKGEIVLDSYWVALPKNAPPGTYQIRVGLYDRTTGVRRPITDPRNDAGGDSLMLDTFEITEIGK